MTVYQHRRKDTNEVFYVGIGTKDRPFNKNGRNIFWKRIIKKTDYSIEILVHSCSKENAIILENIL